jgi:hypothetical protein
MKRQRWNSLLAPTVVLTILAGSWVLPAVQEYRDGKQRVSIMFGGPGGRPIVVTCMNGLLELFASSGSTGEWNAWTVQWWTDYTGYGTGVHWSSFDDPWFPRGLTSPANHAEDHIASRLIGPIQTVAFRSVPGGPPSFVTLRIPIWPLLAMALIWLNWRALPLLRQRRWRRRGLCISCGYDVRFSTETCPECGTPLARKDAVC